jgi:hypothetical protein
MLCGAPQNFFSSSAALRAVHLEWRGVSMSRRASAVFVVFLAGGPALEARLYPPEASPQTSAVPRPQRTRAEERIESRLLRAIERQQRGEPAPPGEQSGLDVDGMDRVLLDIRADVTDALIRAIEDGGGVVVNRFPQYQSVRARLRLGKVVSLAERNDVKFVRAAERAATNPSGR